MSPVLVEDCVPVGLCRGWKSVLRVGSKSHDAERGCVELFSAATASRSTVSTSTPHRKRVYNFAEGEQLPEPCSSILLRWWWCLSEGERGRPRVRVFHGVPIILRIVAAYKVLAFCLRAGGKTRPLQGTNALQRWYRLVSN